MSCSGHGECLSMKDLAARSTVNGDIAGFTYGAAADVNDANYWDAEKILGCDCDAGYTGHDCSLRT